MQSFEEECTLYENCAHMLTKTVAMKTMAISEGFPAMYVT